MPILHGQLTLWSGILGAVDTGTVNMFMICRAFFPPCRHCMQVISMCCIGFPCSSRYLETTFDPWSVPASNVGCQCFFESQILTLFDVFCEHSIDRGTLLYDLRSTSMMDLFRSSQIRKWVQFSKARLGVTLTAGRCPFDIACLQGSGAQSVLGSRH